MTSIAVPQLRVSPCNQAPVRAEGAYVLYWMIAARRVRYSFALDHAVERARELGKPLVILEALRCDYPWASDRLHAFILDGMRGNAERLRDSRALYHPYVEAAPGAGKGLLEALASRACTVVTDDFPCFFLPTMVAAAAEKLDVLTEKVDSNGLLPLRATADVFATAYAFRRFLHKNLPQHLDRAPAADALAEAEIERLDTLPDEITRRWPAADSRTLTASDAVLAELPIDHAVRVGDLRGGAEQAEATAHRFLEERLDSYPQDRNAPERDGSSGLSPYLHFGHISAHELFHSLTKREAWDAESLADKPTGKRAGWWGMSEASEAFLDQLITWRELGYVTAANDPRYDEFEALPLWARTTLDEHAGDPRPHIYTLEQLEAAATDDPLWNAAQTQLVREGRIHNYLRMLWGKKILMWSPSPEETLARIITLNDKYALDGRDPNSYSGISWCLGRYDRPWGPERPIFGKVRYMTSENTARKYRVGAYIERYSAGSQQNLLP